MISRITSNGMFEAQILMTYLSPRLACVGIRNTGNKGYVESSRLLDAVRLADTLFLFFLFFFFFDHAFTVRLPSDMGRHLDGCVMVRLQLFVQADSLCSFYSTAHTIPTVYHPPDFLCSLHLSY